MPNHTPDSQTSAPARKLRDSGMASTLLRAESNVGTGSARWVCRWNTIGARPIARLALPTSPATTTAAAPFRAQPAAFSTPVAPDNEYGAGHPQPRLLPIGHGALVRPHTRTRAVLVIEVGHCVLPQTPAASYQQQPVSPSPDYSVRVDMGSPAPGPGFERSMMPS